MAQNIAKWSMAQLHESQPQHKKAKPSLDREKTQEEIEAEEEEEKRVAKGLRLAHAMFLGLLVDGVPESILLGFLAAELSLSLVLVLSLFVANFPEAFSSASLMKEAEVSTVKIVGMWAALMAVTGILAALACAGLIWMMGGHAPGHEMPFHISMCIAVVEGIAGGAMIACIAAVMLPEAFGRKHETNILMDSGFLCTAGFLCAVLIKIVGGVVTSDDIKHHSEEPHDHVPITTETHADLHGYGKTTLLPVGEPLSHFLMVAAEHAARVIFQNFHF